MSLAAIATSKTVLDTILDFLVALILPSARDRDAAAQAARDLLSDHHPATREELRLAAEVVGFSLQALAALRDAAQPGIPISRAMRLRASACTLRRAEQAAQRKLDALQRVLLPAELIQERAIAVALKNAEPYFAGAYAKAREMGDALIAAESAARPSPSSAMRPSPSSAEPRPVRSEPAPPPATPADGSAPAEPEPAAGGSVAPAVVAPGPAVTETPAVVSLTKAAGLPVHPGGTAAPSASAPAPAPARPPTPSASTQNAPAPTPRAPRDLGASAQSAPVATALAQIASAPAFTVPAQSVSGVATQASPAPSPAPLTADPHPTGSDPQTPHRPASSYPPAPSRGPDGAPPFPPGRIGATLRYMKETLSRMDPNTSETGDFSTDFLVAIDRGLRTGDAQGPVAPAA